MTSLTRPLCVMLLLVIVRRCSAPMQVQCSSSLHLLAALKTADALLSSCEVRHNTPGRRPTIHHIFCLISKPNTHIKDSETSLVPYCRRLVV